MKFSSVLAAAFLALLSVVFADPQKWEKDIAAFEQADREHPPQRGGIVFIGSSTIRLWKTLAEDFAGWRAVNRGFGGSQMEDSANLAERFIFPHEPAAVVVFAGSNDINAGKPPERVVQDFKAFVAKVHGRLPKTEICFLEITSSPSRWAQREKVIEANRLIRKFCDEGPGLKFIVAREKLLGTNGEPRPDLFAPDRLHLNGDGYRILKGAIQPFLPKQ